MTAPLWTDVTAALATGGRATGAFAATGVSIDSRTLAPGDLFVALSDIRDGHDFVADALARGAAAALVARRPAGVAEDAPLLVVPDVLAALGALGAAGRARAAARVAGVTGSAGKTSTKEMLRAILAAGGSVHAAEASHNNHWGVPLTLARLPADTGFAVVEIGMNRPGEIAPLARLTRPHVALITTIAPAHLEAFDDIAGIAREKASIVEGLEPGGVAVLPAGLPTSPILLAAAAGRGARIVTFGDAPGADWRIRTIRPGGAGSVVEADTPEGPRLFRLGAPGAHVASNAIGALAAADALGADPALAVAAIGRWRPPSGRGLRRRIALEPDDPRQGFDLIDDAFNANPASLAAALAVLAAGEPQHGAGRIARGRRIAILGDMLELGPTEAELHRAVARDRAIASVAVVHCVGPRMRALWEALPPGQRGEWTATAPEMAALARRLVDAGDIVLVKGSKGSKVSLVVDALAKLGQALPPDGDGEI
jgi:UDP-N-acetylmuramoyl-tripeptide--D-alanyl-D-alanine ligase